MTKKEFLHGCCRRRAGKIVSWDGVFAAQTNGLTQPWHGNVRRPKDKVGQSESCVFGWPR